MFKGEVFTPEREGEHTLRLMVIADEEEAAPGGHPRQLERKATLGFGLHRLVFSAAPIIP